MRRGARTVGLAYSAFDVHQRQGGGGFLLHHPVREFCRWQVVVAGGLCRVDRNPDFEIFALDFGIKAVWEGFDVTPTPHYHLWLTGKDN